MVTSLLQPVKSSADTDSLDKLNNLEELNNLDKSDRLKSAENSISIAANNAGCSAQKLQEILQPASEQQPSVVINCSITLPANARISKQLIFEGSEAVNLVFDGNGAEINALFAKPAILITSKLDAQTKTWQVPHHLSIKNAKIIGALRIHGMAANGEQELLKQSSHQAGHTERAQQAAPHHIGLDHLILIAREHNMMYFAPGVHHVTLSNSTFTGKSAALALYLDAEGGHHLIENNRFDVQTRTREVIAVDGSAHNIIRHNSFINPQHGGIYVYRNCGEGGTIRHQAPMHNQIKQNYFQLSSASKLPLIWLASRNGHRNYCDADRGYPFGSSINDQDLAQYNTVSQNFFNLKKLPALYRWTMVKQRLIRTNAQPNEVGTNEVSD